MIKTSTNNFSKYELRKLLSFIFIYILSLYTSLSFPTPDSGFSAIWLPNGILLGFLLISNQTKWLWYISLSVVLAVIIQIFHLAFSATSTLLFIFVNVIEVLLATIILKHYCDISEGFKNKQQLVLFFFITIFITSLSAIIPTVYLTSVNDSFLFFNTYIAWFSSAAIGLIFVTPIIIYFKSSNYNLYRKKNLKFLFYLIVTIALSYLSFGLYYDVTHQVFPLLLLMLVLMWASVVIDITEITFLHLVWLLIAVIESSEGNGPFSLTSDLSLSGILGLQLLGILVIGVSFYTFLETRKISTLEKEKELLLSQSKAAMMGEMISLIAHQWKQPLSVLSMVGNNLKTDLELDMFSKDSLPEIVEQIDLQVKHLSNTIDTFRDFLKPDQDKTEIDVENIIENSLEIVNKSLINNDIKLIKEFSSTSEVNISPSELMQVMINLLNNAKDAFKINTIENRKIWIKTYEKNNNTIIELKDTAGGIPRDKIDNIFDAYFTTKSDSGGTGLGLYIVKTIIEEHCNGTIECKNTDSGTCFTITIPSILKKQIQV